MVPNERSCIMVKEMKKIVHCEDCGAVLTVHEVEFNGGLGGECYCNGCVEEDTIIAKQEHALDYAQDERAEQCY